MADDPKPPRPEDYTSLEQALKAPFPPDRVSWRVGATAKDKRRGLALCFIDARDVMERLDAAVGPENWQSRYPHAGEKTVCEIGIKYHGEWVWKADGAGDSDIEAKKGALSDAFKRAAVRWGVGRYLYDLEAPWVDIEPAGNSYKISAHEQPRLVAFLRNYSKSERDKSQAAAHDGDHRDVMSGAAAAPGRSVAFLKPPAGAANGGALGEAKDERPNGPATSRYNLLHPATGKIRTFDRAAKMLSALSAAMHFNDGDPMAGPKEWWDANQVTARNIVVLFPQASKQVEALEELAIQAAQNKAAQEAAASKRAPLPLMPANVKKDVDNNKATTFVNWWVHMVEKLPPEYRQDFVEVHRSLLLRLQGNRTQWPNIRKAVELYRLSL